MSEDVETTKPAPEDTTPRESPATGQANTLSEADSAAPAKADAPAPAPVKARDFAVLARQKQAQLKVARESSAAFERDRQTLAQERAALARDRAELDATLAKVRQIPENPEKALELLGLNKDNFFRRILHDGKESPEEVALRARDDAAKAIKALEDYKEEQRQGHEKWLKEESTRQERHAIGLFARHVSSDAETYPHLNIEYDESEIAAQTSEIVNWARTNGHTYTDHEIADFLEKRATLQHEAKQERTQRIRALSASEPDAEGSTKTANGQTDRRPGSRTLTNKGSTQKVSSPREMTAEEQDQWALAELRAASARDAKAR